MPNRNAEDVEGPTFRRGFMNRQETAEDRHAVQNQTVRHYQTHHRQIQTRGRGNEPRTACARHRLLYPHPEKNRRRGRNRQGGHLPSEAPYVRNDQRADARHPHRSGQPMRVSGRSSAVIRRSFGGSVRKVRGEDHVRSSVSRMRLRALVICASTVLTEIRI